MDLFEKYYPSVQIIDLVVAIMIYKKIAIDNSVYINIFSGETVSYLTVSTDDVLNTTNNETSTPEIRRVFEEWSRYSYT